MSPRSHDHPTITAELIERFAAYRRREPVWGSLHIVMDDGNFGDTHVDFCVRWAEENKDTEGHELALILRDLTSAQRFRLRRRAEAIVEKEEHHARSARSRRAHCQPPPIGDTRIVEWPAEMPRDAFVTLVSQSIDAAAELGYDAPFDGPQIAAWLESPNINERRKASYHMALIRRSIEPSAGAS